MPNSLRNNLVLVDNLVQFDYVHNEEKFVADCICNLLKNNNNQIDISEHLNLYSELDNEQKNAVLECFQNRLFVAYGLAGTGKSFVVSIIYKIATKIGLSVILTSPTGKSAKRVSDLSGAECKTLHRLLGYAPNSEEVFRVNENNKLICDMLIIDEASMVDLNILYHLFKAVDLEKIRICFVGDHRQLSPVRYGSPFKDMCLNFNVPKRTLTEIKRQKVGSGIIEQAHMIQKGSMIIT